MESLSKMKVADLKKHLKNKGLSVAGNKTELVERLQQALQNDENPTLDSSGAVDDEEFDEEEILGGDDVDIGKITQEEEAAALAGNLKVKDDSLLLGATQPEKKKITLKRSAPSLSSTTDADTTQSTEALDESAASNTDPSTNLDNDKENSLGSIEEPKHKVIKLSGTTSENALEARAKKFGSTTTTPSSDTEETRKLARAARFGVDPALSNKSSNTSTNKRVPKLSMEVGSTDLDKLKKRAERFGEVTSKSLSKLEELEKKKLRQNRFSQEGNSEKATETTYVNI
ncbi:Uncharacterized protein Anas_11594 [Armadillidium nasatum]|uniref:SAP domain-containing protein n=1 Tax=Armadillidium nasatum TaxID=96803 RepID=A0A5N5SJM7_9CRUS|nr:Uncharacterized protein Anas_11594 [Armadillidium nasatum]